jgi:hypothetical protein
MKHTPAALHAADDDKCVRGEPGGSLEGIEIAVKERYRFFNFGDAMMIL